MEFKTMKAAVQSISMPDDMKLRIERNCKTQLSATGKEPLMKPCKNHAFFRRPAAVFAALALCLTLSVTALASADILTGFFRDITGWQGAVVGTSYEQATDEIGMSVTVNGDELTVLAAFADPQRIPYRYTERLGIAAYRIVDANGNVVKEGSAKSAEVVNGQAAVSIPLDDIARGSYRLVVDAFVSEKKADRPMTISGSWECAFSR